MTPEEIQRIKDLLPTTLGSEEIRKAANRLQKIVGKEQSNPLQADAKTTREIRKAAKRAQKNIDKILKTIEQAKKKAGSEEEAELYDLLIKILSDPEKEDD